MIFSIAAFASLQAVAAQPQPQLDHQAEQLRYKGFTVDITSVQPMADRAAFLDALRQQIDIVDNVVLSGEKREFFRSVPLVAVFVEQAGPGRNLHDGEDNHYESVPPWKPFNTSPRVPSRLS